MSEWKPMGTQQGGQPHIMTLLYRTSMHNLFMNTTSLVDIPSLHYLFIGLEDEKIAFTKNKFQ